MIFNMNFHILFFIEVNIKRKTLRNVILTSYGKYFKLKLSKIISFHFKLSNKNY